jgi:hypothetical protein
MRQAVPKPLHLRQSDRDTRAGSVTREGEGGGEREACCDRETRIVQSTKPRERVAHTFPLCVATVGSMRLPRNARSRAKVPSSSKLAIRLKPTTSAARLPRSSGFPSLCPSRALHYRTKTTSPEWRLW